MSAAKHRTRRCRGARRRSGEANQTERLLRWSLYGAVAFAVVAVGDPFPFAYAGDGSGTQDRSGSLQRDERRRHHWRRLAEAAHRAVLQLDLPVVTVGVDRTQAFLREVSAWPEDLAVAVLGSPDAMDRMELVDAYLLMLYFSLFFLWVWLLISVFADVFRSEDLGGVAKAAWVVLLVVLPYLGVLIYLIARGVLTENEFATQKIELLA